MKNLVIISPEMNELKILSMFKNVPMVHQMAYLRQWTLIYEMVIENVQIGIQILLKREI
jgi:hypothetical protein